MRYSILTCIIFSLLAYACGKPDPTGDSDGQRAYKYLELAYELNANEKYDSAMTVINKGLELKNVSDSTKGMLNAEMSTVYNLTGDMDKALIYGKKASNCAGAR